MLQTPRPAFLRTEAQMLWPLVIQFQHPFHWTAAAGMVDLASSPVDFSAAARLNDVGAFHHLLDPAGFIERIGTRSDRFFLIEPAGNRFGQWQRTMDLDWLVDALSVIRDRLEYQFDLTPAAHEGSTPAPPAGEPTEHRYSMDDFSRWFAGYGLDMAGTVAGLERYGTSPYARSPLRDDIGRTIYSLVVELEAALRRANLDLAAKTLGHLRRARPQPSGTPPADPPERSGGGPARRRL
jgi:hypothetical protein